MKYRSTRSLSGSSDLYSFEEVLFSPGLDPIFRFKKNSIMKIFSFL
jgi:hypothetical protein